MPMSAAKSSYFITRGYFVLLTVSVRNVLRSLTIVLGLGTSRVPLVVFLKAMEKVNKHGGVLFFLPNSIVSSFQGKSRSYEIFSRQKFLFALLANEKKCLSISICGAEREIS